MIYGYQINRVINIYDPFHIKKVSEYVCKEVLSWLVNESRNHLIPKESFSIIKFKFINSNMKSFLFKKMICAKTIERLICRLSWVMHLAVDGMKWS